MMCNTLNGQLVEAYFQGRSILLKPPASRSEEEREFLKLWLLERVHLLSALQLTEGMPQLLAYIWPTPEINH